MQAHRLGAYGLLAASMALVGSYVGLSKLLVAVFPVLLLAWLRFGIAALAMASWVRGETLSLRDKKLLFWESFFGNFLFSICMLYGVSLTSAVAAGVMMSAIPAVCAVMSWAILRERITLRIWAAIGCAALGIALLATARSPVPITATNNIVTSESIRSAPGNYLGYFLLFAAVCCEAFYVVIGKKLTGSVSAKRISAIINLWGLALVTPFALYQALRFDFAAVPMSIWALLIFYSLAASMATVWLWMTGLKHVPAANAGVMTVMLPISAALVGVLLLNEPFTAAHAGAFVLALLGLLLATYPAPAPSA
jgi:drug/metabolite transporter (DMT)-like permease